MAQPLALKVRAVIDSSVVLGQRLVQGQTARVGENGMLRMQLHPYRSINVDASACTALTINQLARFGDGVALRVSWRSRIACRFRASLKITSTLLSRRSRVEGDANGRRVLFRGTAGAISVGARGETLIGLSKGRADVFYGSSRQSVPTGFFVRSPDGQPLSKPEIALPPSLESIQTLPNGLHRVCTIADNQIRSAVGYAAVLVGDANAPGVRTCLDTVLEDTMTVMSVTGVEQSYKFLTISSVQR